MVERLVIALGGNALGNNPQEQLELVKTTASTIVDLVEEGYDVIVGHGNGPQVGMVNLAFENSHNKVGGTPTMPFPECGAMTQGYIGYHLQQSITNEIAKRGIKKNVACVVTQVEVDPSDPAFKNPTKPIGSFYTKEEADKIVAETGYTFVEDAGRGYRRVVPSPKPVSIVELEVVDTPPSEKGNTSQGGTKPATLETGAVVNVPFFVANGDIIRVDTRTNEYLDRV